MNRFWTLTFLTLTFNLTLKFKITILMQFRSKFQNVVQNFRQVLPLPRIDMIKFWTLTSLTLTLNLTLKFKIIILMQFRSKFQTSFVSAQNRNYEILDLDLFDLDLDLRGFLFVRSLESTVLIQWHSKFQTSFVFPYNRTD